MALSLIILMAHIAVGIIASKTILGIIASVPSLGSSVVNYRKAHKGDNAALGIENTGIGTAAKTTDGNIAKVLHIATAMGDADGDGNTNTLDTSPIKLRTSGKIIPKDAHVIVVDISGDGKTPTNDPS